MKFPAKKDVWLSIIVWGCMLFSIGSGLYALLFVGGLGIGGLIGLVLATIALPIFLLWMFVDTFYFLNEKELIIQFGPFKKVVTLESIKSVKKTMNPLSSPAPSLKRIEILYGKYGMVLISPKNRDEFIHILKERCPYIKIERQ